MENRCAFASGTFQTFSMLCHATCCCETSGHLSYLGRMLSSAHFSCQAWSFQDWQILCMMQIMFVRPNVPCFTTITVPVVRIHTACCWNPHYMRWESISILCSWFTTSVPCMLLLLRTLRCPVTKLFALVARKFLFCVVNSSFHGFTEIHFHTCHFHVQRAL